MQIDSAVVSVLLCVEVHQGSSSLPSGEVVVGYSYRTRRVDEEEALMRIIGAQATAYSRA